MMRSILLAFVFVFAGITVYGENCDSVKHSRSYTLILAQLTSIKKVDVDSGFLIKFIPIDAYTNIAFKLLLIDSVDKTLDTIKQESEFHKRLRGNEFKIGSMKKLLEAKPVSYYCFATGLRNLKKAKISNYRKHQLVFLSVDILSSSDDELVIDFIIDPVRVDISKLTKIE